MRRTMNPMFYEMYKHMLSRPLKPIHHYGLTALLVKYGVFK
jgi:hypothetical protein